MNPIKILGLASSLRVGSTTTGLLRAAASKLPDQVSLEILVPHNVPMFNEDIEKQDHLEVNSLRTKIKAADAVLFSVCEYNASISPVLKNAIDWASRGPLGNVFNNKPAGIIGAGGLGSIKAQQHLRDIGSQLNLHMLNHPLVYVSIFDPSQPVNMTTGDVRDEAVFKQLEAFMVAFAKHISLYKK